MENIDQHSINFFFKYYTSFSPIIEKICEPLFDISGISYFTYLKQFTDGKILRFSNLDQWTEQYFHHKIFNDKSFYINQLSTIPLFGEKRFLWTGNPSEHVYSLLHANNIWNGLSIYQRHLNFIESFHFASTLNNPQVLEFYIQNDLILKKFILHFKEKFSHIIDKSEDQNLKFTTLLPYENQIVPAKDYPFTIKKYPLYNGNKNICLSKREFECIFHLAHGKSIKEIANVLSLSSRTISSYVDNIKMKVGSNRTSDLLNLFFHNFLHHSPDDPLSQTQQNHIRIGSHE